MSKAPQVLVVDDDVDVLKQIVLFLGNSYDVVGVPTIAEAIALFDSHGSQIRVLVSDMYIDSEKHGGLRLARHLRQVGLDTEILFLTAFGDIEDATPCMQVGAFGYIEKAKRDTYDQLRDLVRKAHTRWLRNHRPESRSRILVVDDDHAVLKQLTEFLARGFDVVSADSLAKARELSQTAAEAPIAVVVADMRLHGQKHAGIALAEELRARSPHPEVIILTGLPEIGDASLCMQAGVCGYIIKAQADTFIRLDELCWQAEQAYRLRASASPVAPPLPIEVKSAGTAVNPPPVPTPTQAPTTCEIFVSYSHRDRRACEDLQRHLAALRISGKVTVWSDKMIQPSASWREEIEAALDRASLGIALITSSYLASPFCMDIEMQRFFEARSQRGLRLIAVIVSECLWQGIPVLKDIQVVPQDQHGKIRPIKMAKNKDEAWTTVVKSIAELLGPTTNPG